MKLNGPIIWNKEERFFFVGGISRCFWLIRFFPKYKKYQPSFMTSKSLDGDIATRIVEAGGVAAVRGSSSRGGIAALKEMIQRTKQYRLAAHILGWTAWPGGSG